MNYLEKRSPVALHRESQDENRQKSLAGQVREGASAAVMQGSGETYLSAFALLLQATPFQIGLLAAVPPIIGTAAQLLSVKVLDRVKSRKPLILFGAAGQALAWLPLFFLPMLFPSYGAWLLLTGVAVYVAMGHLTVPAWNSLITDMIDADRRGMYFARRARVIALTSFAALSVAGIILHTSETWTNPAWGFGIIFVFAAIARLISTGYLARLQESPAHEGLKREAGVRDFLRARRSVMFRRFLVFSGCFHVAAMMAGPFFVIYLLRDLHLTYLQYGLWLAAPILGQLLSLQEWGRIADTFGNKKVLVLTGFIIPILPILYLFSSNCLMLVGINFLSGLIWPGFSLSLGNYVFDAVQPGDRTKGVAIYNTVNAIGAGIGAMLGSWLATVAPSQLFLFGLILPLASNLPILFLVSGLLRLIVSLTLLNTFKERRRVTPISHRDFLSELPLIKPIAVAIGSKIVRR
ncbi:MAG: MFS transporter [Nitrospirota bacterium]|nr:MFS transporter [Nitrospirota bacterium]